jgi:carbonic anhydrase
MCHHCESAASTLSRRRVLAAAMALAAAPTLACAAAAGRKLSPDEALARLLEGNGRFIAEPQLCLAQLARQREGTATQQRPWATVLTCSDSRVPPELLFGGVGIGQLFVARNAGNTADAATLGTIEYGCRMLGVPLVVVLGHERCGAVSAACKVVDAQASYAGSMAAMLRPIVPAARATQRASGDRVDAAVREHALQTARRIARRSAIVAEGVRQGTVKVLAARYGLGDGRVEILDGAPR